MFHVSQFNLLIEELIGGVPGQEVYTPHAPRLTGLAYPHALNKKCLDQLVEGGFRVGQRPMCQSLSLLPVRFKHLFWGVHVLSVAIYFDGVDFAALFPFPDLFGAYGEVEVFVHEGDEFFEGHGVSGL